MYIYLFHVRCARTLSTSFSLSLTCFHLCDKWLLGLWELPLETSKNQKNIDERSQFAHTIPSFIFFFLLLLRCAACCRSFVGLERRTSLRSNFYSVLNMFDLNISFGIYALRHLFCRFARLVLLATIRDVLTFHHWAAENRLSPIEVIERFLIGFSSSFSSLNSIEVQLFPIHFNSSCFGDPFIYLFFSGLSLFSSFFLPNRLIADWHTIGRSTIYGAG